MRFQRLAALGTAALTAVLCLPADDVFAGGTYRCPPAVAASSRADNTRQTSYLVPAGAPVDRNYSWYAPPPGYQVVVQGTPAAPRTVTVVGPDGSARATRLEGPVVVRLQYYLVRQGSR
jgi:hypothetical protein